MGKLYRKTMITMYLLANRDINFVVESSGTER